MLVAVLMASFAVEVFIVAVAAGGRKTLRISCGILKLMMGALEAA